MTKEILASTAFALFCASSMRASAAQPYPYNYHETDGLSRNPNDCVVWGCIDSN